MGKCQRDQISVKETPHMPKSKVRGVHPNLTRRGKSGMPRYDEERKKEKKRPQQISRKDESLLILNSRKEIECKEAEG